MEFKVGDTIRLKSYGPFMTVLETYQGNSIISCIWFLGDGTGPFYANLPSSCLVKIPEGVEVSNKVD